MDFGWIMGECFLWALEKGSSSRSRGVQEYNRWNNEIWISEDEKVNLSCVSSCIEPNFIESQEINVSQISKNWPTMFTKRMPSFQSSHSCCNKWISIINNVTLQSVRPVFHLIKTMQSHAEDINRTHSFNHTSFIGNLEVVHALKEIPFQNITDHLDCHSAQGSCITANNGYTPTVAVASWKASSMSSFFFQTHTHSGDKAHFAQNYLLCSIKNKRSPIFSIDCSVFNATIIIVEYFSPGFTNLPAMLASI